MSSEAMRSGTSAGYGSTERHDLWWVNPALVALGFGAFIVYSTFRAFHNEHFIVGAHGVLPHSAELVSPMYSPLLSIPGWFPAWFSPAFLILWIPAGFRVTCYYYRKAYYRAFFLDPQACAVGEFRYRNDGYPGETDVRIFQNAHRFFLYLAVLLIIWLTRDAIIAFFWPVFDDRGVRIGTGFGVSVGTLVLALNAFLLGAYTFGCHSLRHLVGGNLNCFSCERFGQTRYKAWRFVTLLNHRHMMWAWLSLFWVGFTDFYVWMIASGRWHDFQIM